MLEQKVIIAYTDGSPIPLIAESFKISKELVRDILLKYKEENTLKKSFTVEFRKMIAQRDIGGIARSSIAKELDINPNTVKKACEDFGQAIKEKAVSDRAFTRINGDFDMNECPSCNSKKVNEVDDNTIYCKKCGSEHIIHKSYEDKDGVLHNGYALKVNFEYLEE